MSDLADSKGLRVAAYVAVALLALVARRREARRASDGDGAWSMFWVLTSALFVGMALGRLGDIGGLVTDLGRERAYDSGWYGSRRFYQVAVVAMLGVTWFVSVAVACWRSPERRRRYLPMSLAAITIVAFAAFRVVSLHQVDTVLYRRDVAGVGFGALFELSLLAIAGGITTWIPRANSGWVNSESGLERSTAPE